MVTKSPLIEVNYEKIPSAKKGLPKTRADNVPSVDSNFNKNTGSRTEKQS